ncbi:MAG: hypothetical protein KC422_25030 [Trueperaceae bacterium]|nr:hypothetical protein [Trueperaceae bacterium]
MLKCFKVVFVLFALTTLAHAQEGLLSGALAQELDTKQVLLNYQDKFSSLSLLPNHALAERIRSELAEREGQTAVEVLTRIRLTEAEQAKLTRLELYNLLRSVSTMQGIQYYSVTYGRMRELFTSSYAVADAKAKTALADPLVENVPEQDELLMVQEDTTFGQNVYRADYYVTQSDDAILVDIVNETTLRFNLVPVFEPNNLFTSMLIVPDGQGSVLFYGVTAAKVPPIPFVKSRFQESLINRLIALRGWFEDSLAEL